MFAATESSLSAIRFPEKNNESSVKFCHYIIAYQMDQEWTRGPANYFRDLF